MLAVRDGSNNRPNFELVEMDAVRTTTKARPQLHRQHQTPVCSRRPVGREHLLLTTCY